MLSSRRPNKADLKTGKSKPGLSRVNFLENVIIILKMHLFLAGPVFSFSYD